MIKLILAWNFIGFPLQWLNIPCGTRAKIRLKRTRTTAGKKSEPHEF